MLLIVAPIRRGTTIMTSVCDTCIQRRSITNNNKNSCRNTFNFFYRHTFTNVYGAYLGMFIFKTLGVHRTNHENNNDYDDDTTQKEEKQKEREKIEPTEEKNKNCHRRWVLCITYVIHRWKWNERDRLLYAFQTTACGIDIYVVYLYIASHLRSFAMCVCWLHATNVWCRDACTLYSVVLCGNTL